MLDLANKHADAVVACYGISAFLLLVLTLVIVFSARRNERELAQLESRREKRKKTS